MSTLPPTPALPTRRPVRATNDAAPLRSDVHPRLRLRYGAVFASMFAMLVGFLIGVLVGVSLVMGATADSSSKIDPWNGVPVCTDAIADAGGVCHGEPR